MDVTPANTVKDDARSLRPSVFMYIRNRESKEAALKHVNKELANIRRKFMGGESATLKRTYLARLFYAFLFGIHADSDNSETMSVPNSNKYTDKQIGHLFISILSEKDGELIKLMSQAISRADYNIVILDLAVESVRFMYGEAAATTFRENPASFFDEQTMAMVRHSAIHGLHKLFHKKPTCINWAEYASRILRLLTHSHMGVVTSAASLIDALSKKSPEAYKGCVPLSIASLTRIVTSASTEQKCDDSTRAAVTWLLRLLQNYNSYFCLSFGGDLTKCLEWILSSDAVYSSNKESHSTNSICLEACSIIIHSKSNTDLAIHACNHLVMMMTHGDREERSRAVQLLYTVASSELIDYVRLFVPLPMSADELQQRWFDAEMTHAERRFIPKHPLEKGEIQGQLSDIGFYLVEVKLDEKAKNMNVDKKIHYVDAAGSVSIKGREVPVLLFLESKGEENEYVLYIRSENRQLAESVSELITLLF